MITIIEKIENVNISGQNFTFFKTEVEKPIKNNQTTFYPRIKEFKIFQSEKDKNEYLKSILN